MTDNFKLITPVAFLVFNRPDTTQRVFDEIRRARPPKLLVVADGPRVDRSGEAEKCLAVRSIIDTIDWPCEVLKNYSEINLGCKLRMSSGIDWVFEQVEEAIILEDDCLPHPTFFRFCQELLELYRENDMIFAISGTNVISSTYNMNDSNSYFCSKYPHIWGWASWRRSWKLYDVTMKRWPEIRDSKKITEICGTGNELAFWKNCFDSVYNNKVNTWDAQVVFTCFCNNVLSLFPTVNLISNIGFGENATHTKEVNSLSCLATHKVHFPLNHLNIISRDIKNDLLRVKIEYSEPNIFSRLLSKLLR